MEGVERRGFSMEAIVLMSICAGYVGWVLSLPVFTTQDGPMHLYYAHVMLALFGHGPEVYKRFYTIKHLLPPYSAYYYLLIGLSRVMPLFLADKLVICGYMVSFVYGFRYLARAVGPAAEQASLLATLIVLNWPLGMGFVNFCLGVSLALWTLGVWMRMAGQAGLGRKVLFVAMCCVLVLVHPVPLLAVMGYCTVDFLVRFWRRRDGSTITRADAVCLLLALCTVGYVKLFTIAHVAQQMAPDAQSPVRIVLQNSLEYARGQGLSFFSQFMRDASPAKRLYRLLLVTVVPLSLGLAARQAWRSQGLGRPRASALWFWLTLGMIAVEPFVPRDMNASHFFAERLLIFIWIGAFLAMSGYAEFSRPARLTFMATAIVGALVTLWTADAPMRAAANEMARLEQTPVAHAGELGMALDDWRPQPVSGSGLTFNPYLWATVNYFRHNDAVLYNTPWMDLTVIPLGAREGLATGEFSPNTVEDPRLLRDAMSDPALSEKALARIRFVVENHVDRPALAGSDPLLMNWACPVERGWYAVCTR